MNPRPISRPMFFILDADHRPTPVDIETWSHWFATNAAPRRRVDYTMLTDSCYVSTVFVGIDMRGAGPPSVFETMIFGSKLDQSCWRYAAWDDAQVGHEMAVRKASAALIEDT